jgi:hypothetical protein
VAISLTTRLSAGYSGSDAATATSASFTPSANSKLYVVVFVVDGGGDGSDLDIVHTSNTGGLTFTRLIQSTHSGGGNGGKIALFEASVGGSPSSMTVTFDVDSDGSETAYTWIGAFDATGTSVQVKSGQIITSVGDGSGGSSASLASGTLPSAVTSGNTAVFIIGRNNDGGAAASVPSGWTAQFNPTDTYISGVCFKKTDFTGTSVTCTDVGDFIYAMGSILLELEEAGGGGGTTHALASTGSGTSTGSAALALQAKVSATGTGTTSGSAALQLAPGALSASGSGSTAGSANLNATLALSATGASSSAGSAALTIVGGSTTHELSSTGTGTTGGSAALIETLALSSTGASQSTGSAALISTLRLAATGTGQTAGSAALSVRAKLSATGTGTSAGSAALTILGPASVHQLSATGISQSSGSAELILVEPVFFFSPPTHEEPIRVNSSGPFRVLAYHRMTYANSLIKVGGTWRAVRVPDPAVVTTLEEGVTFFRGGYEYEIDRTVALDLAAAGYTSTPI